MKKLKLLVAAFAAMAAFTATAQITPSSNPETSIGASSGITRTANDSRLVTVGTALGTLNVVAWDGSNPRIFYTSSCSSGTIALPTGAMNPDVAISTDPTFSNTYLLIVYRMGSTFRFVRFPWTGCGFGSAITFSLSDIAGSYFPGTTVDAGANGDYVFQVTRSNGQINSFGGPNSSLSGPPAPPMSGVLPPGTGHQTDIALDCAPGTGTPTNMHITYTDLTNSKLVTQLAPYTTFSYTGIVPVAGPVSGTTYLDPKIASPVTNSPNSSCVGVDVFSIAYNEQGTTGSIIRMYSQDATGITNVRLTSAAPGFPTPAFTTCKRPALSFNQKFSWISPNPCSSGITCGWETGASTPSSLYGEKLLSNGTINGGVTYYTITSPTRNTCYGLAASSKYTNDGILLSYADNTTVVYKFFSYAAATLRKTGTAAEPVKNITLYPNPSAGNIYMNTENIRTDADMRITAADITGKSVFTYSGVMNNTPAAVSNWFSAAMPGIYFVRFADDAGYMQTIKVIKE